ncbi:hypothetical protein KEM54_000547 [Ascosphaera aggregata]|nr:hypothetical protein KEM54_000547 [Ascosphaera aggregata]
MVKPLTFKGDKPRKRKHHHSHKEESSEDREDRQVARRIKKEEAAAAETYVEDQVWVSADVPSDISGPVLIVLPSTPPTCVASDALGNVFAMVVENLIEGNPSTAEPHDVRQVWVALKVAGTEGLQFKGHHGKYLSCDKYGMLSASSSAVAVYETFIPIQSPDTPGTFSLQIAGGDLEQFISIKKKESREREGKTSVQIRGDEDTVGFTTTLRIRMQAKFKPSVKASREKSKATHARISKLELEQIVGRRLEDEEVRRLKRARREGTFHEEVLDVRVKGKHDKFAS